MTTKWKTHLLGAAISLSAVAAFAAPASAAMLGYELRFNDPVFNTANGVNNVPDIQLENISDPGTGRRITDFKLSIGNIDFAFDFVREESAIGDGGAPLVATLITPDLDNDNVGMDFVEYDFMGFDPNEIFQFEVDVDNDDGTFLQDYREILFPTSEVMVTFSNGTVLSQTLDAAGGQDSYRFRQTVEVPEPSTLALFGTMLIAGASLRRRK